MGWRAHDAYDRAEREAWRKLPLRERYHWDGILIAIVILGAAAWFVFM